MCTRNTDEMVAQEIRDRRLPEGFSALEPFVDSWLLPDSRARAAKRQASDMDALREFYGAMQPVAEPALAYLARYAPDELPPSGTVLLKLMLALAEVSTAVEWYGSAQVPDSFEFSRFELMHQTPDEGTQR